MLRPMSNVYCCIDIEASGPVPAKYDIVSLGAVAVLPGPDGAHAILPSRFYVELQPQGGIQDPHAMAIHGLSDVHLRLHGVALDAGLLRLNAWANGIRKSPADELVFVGHNAPFDWSYVSYCYQAAGVPNPFGWKALCTKALAMGVLDLEWLATHKENLARQLPGLGDQEKELVHRADYDALYQARILVGLLDHPRRRAAMGR